MMRTRRYAIPSAHAVGTHVTEGVVDRQLPSEYAMRACPGCGRQHLLKVGELCPWCRPANAFGAPTVLIDAGGEDSPHPDRIADGSHVFNAGLPPVKTDAGWRPISNAELANNHGVREYAKRHGLEPLSRGRYRGLK